MLLNLFDQYTNLCFNITKIFFYICNFINYAWTVVFVYWLIDFFLACSLIVAEWYSLNSWVWNYILISFVALVYKYNVYIDDEIDDDD